MNRPLSLIALTLLALPGCQSVEPPPPSEVGFWQGTTSGIERRELRVLATDFWEGWLRWHPARATALGDPANLGRWPSTNESIRGRWEEGVWEQRTKLSLLDRPALPTPDRINADQLDRALATETIWITHELDRWLLDPLEGSIHSRVRRCSSCVPRRSNRHRPRASGISCSSAGRPSARPRDRGAPSGLDRESTWWIRRLARIDRTQRRPARLPARRLDPREPDAHARLWRRPLGSADPG
ncbi:MAG: hypothetical protein ACYTFV_19095 [Planctomycetota bacterium]|jgi:hypothetical protein